MAKKVKELKAREVAIQDALKEAQDKANADRAEAEGHSRLAHKLDSEAKSLGDARKAAAKVAKEDTAKLHAEKLRQAGDGAKKSAKKGAAKMHGLIFEELKARVQVVAKAEVVKAADLAVKQEIHSASHKFLMELKGQMVDAARKDGRAAALAAAKVAIAAHHDKFGRVTKSVADQAKKDVKKMAEKKAESEVKKSAKKHVGVLVSKKAEVAAHDAVLQASASYKKDMGDLADQMSHKQLGAYKKEEVNAKKHGVNLIAPESKKFEEEKLLYILHKYGPKKALDDAKIDVVDATEEHAKAVHMLTVAHSQERQASEDLLAMKTPEEKKLANKVVFDTRREVENAKELVSMTAANLKKQEAVKAHTDKMVRDYEAGKKAQIAKGAKEASANKKSVAEAKMSAKKVILTGKSAKDKADAKAALGKARAKEIETKTSAAKVDAAISSSKNAGTKQPAEKKTDLAIHAAKRAHTKLAKATVLHRKAQEVTATISDPQQRQLASHIEGKAMAARDNAKREADESVRVARESADKEKADVKTGNGEKIDGDARETAVAKSDHDKKKLKRETEIQYQLSKLQAMEDGVDKDENVLTRLKTATGAQVKYDIDQLKEDVKNTPHMKLIQQKRADMILKRARREQARAEKFAKKASKGIQRAVQHATTPNQRKQALKLLKHSALEDKRDKTAAKRSADATTLLATGEVAKDNAMENARLLNIEASIPQ